MIEQRANEMSSLSKLLLNAVLCWLVCVAAARAAEPVMLAPTNGAKAVDAELWPGAPVIAHLGEKKIELRRRADGSVVMGDLMFIEVHPDFAILNIESPTHGADELDSGRFGVMAHDGRMIFPVESRFIEYFEVCNCFVKVDADGVRLFDVHAQPRTDLVFDDLRISYRTSERFWAVVRQGKYGVLDAQTAQLVVPTQYERTEVVRDMIFANDGDQWHVLDLHGAPIAGLEAMDDLDFWPEANALIVDKSKLVAPDGKVLMPAGRYRRITPAGKYAIVERNDKYGLIDLNRKEVVAPKFAVMAQVDKHEDTDRFLIALDGFNGHRYGMIDATGKLVMPPVFSEIERGSAEYAIDPTNVIAKQFPYLNVSRDDKLGVYDFDGKALLEPIYLKIYTEHSGAPWMLVIDAHWRRGLYNVALRKFTIPMGRFDELVRYDEIGQGDELYRFRRNGRFGLVDRNGRLILPADYDLLVVSDRAAPMLAGVRQGKPEGIVLERNATGIWRALPERRPVVPGPGHDGHPIAAMLDAHIDARYLPEGYETPEQIRAAVADGRLAQATPPSIQMSGETAYVGFGNFKADARSGALPNAMTVCFDNDGFRLLTKAPLDGRKPDGSRACNDARAPALHFKGELDAQLECIDCERHGIPKVWKRQHDAIACTLMPWQPETAAARWHAWQTAMQAAWNAELPDGQQTTNPNAAQYAVKTALAELVDPETPIATALAALRMGKSSWAQGPAQARNVDADRVARTVLDWLWHAQPAGDGGRYPEARSELPQCARVWYLKLDDLEAALRTHARDPKRAWNGEYALPPAGELARNTYPFVTMTESDTGLRLTGISRELIEMAAWYVSVHDTTKQ